MWECGHHHIDRASRGDVRRAKVAESHDGSWHQVCTYALNEGSSGKLPPMTTSSNMASRSCLHGTTRILSRSSFYLPEYLIPAFTTAPATRPFTSSSKRASRIGSAPLSLPPEVYLRMLDPPKQKKVISRVVRPRVLEVEGPLGRSIASILTRSSLIRS